MNPRIRSAFSIVLLGVVFNAFGTDYTVVQAADNVVIVKPADGDTITLVSSERLAVYVQFNNGYGLKVCPRSLL